MKNRFPLCPSIIIDTDIEAPAIREMRTAVGNDSRLEMFCHLRMALGEVHAEHTQNYTSKLRGNTIMTISNNIYGNNIDPTEMSFTVLWKGGGAVV